MKILLIAFFSLVLAAMLWVTITASFDRSVFDAATDIWNDPWARATLFDAYFGFLTVFIWIAYRERSWGARFVWLLLLLGLGNFAIAGYFLTALLRLRPWEPWTAIFERRGSAS